MYKEVIVKSAKDLPKEEGLYFVWTTSGATGKNAIEYKYGFDTYWLKCISKYLIEVEEKKIA